MRAEERVWWEELADRYEGWAEDPPLSKRGLERYTCNAVGDEFGFWGCALGHLRHLWLGAFSSSDYPAGIIMSNMLELMAARQRQRFEFCHYMAETIREYLEDGRLP